MAELNKLGRLRLLEDQPVPDHNVDELQLLPFSRVIADTAVGTDGPFTIGVYASWGHGKTSVLRQAKSLIDEVSISGGRRDPRRHVITVWFNAWQYEREEHPIVPLVASIIREVEKKRVDSKAPAKVREAWRGMSRTLRAIAYGFSAKAKVQIPGFAGLEAGFVAKDMIEREEQL